MSPNKPYQTEKVAVFIFLSAIWIYAGVWVMLGFPIYRDQHLGTAIKYANEGVDLLRTVIIGFNATGTGTPQEFPVWQALAGLALRLMGGWWEAATIVSLLLFSLSLPFFGKAAKEDSDAKTAWIALLFLLSQPLVFHLAGGAQTGGLSLGLLFFFFYSSKSQRLHAAQATNPGSANRKRVLWESFTTPEFRDWRNIYRSEDLVIKELPSNIQ
jgi:hypothetical protein